MADEDFLMDSFLKTSELSLLVRSEEEKTTHKNNNGMLNLWPNSNVHKGMVRGRMCLGAFVCTCSKHCVQVLTLVKFFANLVF